MWLQSRVADGNCLVHIGHRWLLAKVAELRVMLESGTETLAEGCKLAGLASCEELVELSEGCRDGNEALAISGVDH